MEGPEIIGRYALYEKIASGGMASVHIGRMVGEVGFSRTVAIKRMHAQFTGDPAFVSMFLDEARLAARIRHPNVVSTLDVVASGGELFLVLEYVQGETLSGLARRLKKRRERIPIPIVAAIMSGVLHGLHAAHEAKDERGEPLGIVHRDVSPQNIIVGIDGVPRVLDFGVAKAAGRLHTTQTGALKGKLAYMSQEQLVGGALTQRCDIYSASVVLWEALVGHRLFKGETEGAIVQSVLNAYVGPPSAERPDVPPQLDAVVLRGLARDPAQRFATAREMATALEAAAAVAIAPTVGAWVDGIAAEALSEQSDRIARIESASHSSAAELLRWRPDGPPNANPDPREPSARGPVGVSASQVSAVSLPEAVKPASGTRRSAMLGLAAALGASAVTFAVMQARAPAPDLATVPTATASAAPSATTAALAARPPPTGTTSSPDPAPVTTADAGAVVGAATVPAFARPSESATVNRPRSPAPFAPRPAPARPTYDPSDHL